MGHEKDEIIEGKQKIIVEYEVEFAYIKSKQDIAKQALEKATAVEEEFSCVHPWKTHFLEVFEIAFMVCEGVGMRAKETEAFKAILEKERAKRKVREEMHALSRSRSTTKAQMQKLK